MGPWESPHLPKAMLRTGQARSHLSMEADSGVSCFIFIIAWLKEKTLILKRI